MDSCVLCRMLKQIYNNHGQNIVDKLMKLSKIGFSMECFTADFLQFFSATVKICLWDSRLGNCHQFKACQRFY